MPDELEQQIEAFATELGDDHPAVKALRTERTERKAAQRTVKVLEVLGQYPTAGIKAEDVEGLALDKIEALAQRLVATPAPSAPKPDEPKPETQVEPTPAEKAFAQAQAIPEGTPPKVTAQKLGLNAAWALRKKNPAEYERLRAAGMIDLGVVPEDRGGSIVFNPGV
jgi:hypothetical protein